MFLCYVKKHTGGTYRILNLRTKRIVLSCDIRGIKKTYRQYISRKENTKEDTNILQDEYNSYNWDHVKNDSVKTEVNTENVKSEGNLKTEQDYRGDGDVQKTINSVSF